MTALPTFSLLWLFLILRCRKLFRTCLLAKPCWLGILFYKVSSRTLRLRKKIKSYVKILICLIILGCTLQYGQARIRIQNFLISQQSITFCFCFYSTGNKTFFKKNSGGKLAQEMPSLLPLCKLIQQMAEQAWRRGSSNLLHQNLLFCFCWNTKLASNDANWGRPSPMGWPCPYPHPCQSVTSIKNSFPALNRDQHYPSMYNYKLGRMGDLHYCFKANCCTRVLLLLEVCICPFIWIRICFVNSFW